MTRLNLDGITTSTAVIYPQSYAGLANFHRSHRHSHSTLKRIKRKCCDSNINNDTEAAKNQSIPTDRLSSHTHMDDGEENVCACMEPLYSVDIMLNLVHTLIPLTSFNPINKEACTEHKFKLLHALRSFTILITKHRLIGGDNITVWTSVTEHRTRVHTFTIIQKSCLWYCIQANSRRQKQFEKVKKGASNTLACTLE